MTDIQVVPIFGVLKDEEAKFYDIFSKVLYFSGLEPTRKTQEEGKYQSLTTTSNKYNVLLEIDRLLTNHFNNANVARCFPSKINVSIANNHFLTYATTLEKSHHQLQITIPC